MGVSVNGGITSFFLWVVVEKRPVGLQLDYAEDWRLIQVLARDAEDEPIACCDGITLFKDYDDFKANGYVLKRVLGSNGKTYRLVPDFHYDLTADDDPQSFGLIVSEPRYLLSRFLVGDVEEGVEWSDGTKATGRFSRDSTLWRLSIEEAKAEVRLTELPPPTLGPVSWRPGSEFWRIDSLVMVDGDWGADGVYTEFLNEDPETGSLFFDTFRREGEMFSYLLTRRPWDYATGYSSVDFWRTTRAWYPLYALGSKLLLREDYQHLRIATLGRGPVVLEDSPKVSTSTSLRRDCAWLKSDTLAVVASSDRVYEADFHTGELREVANLRLPVAEWFQENP